MVEIVLCLYAFKLPFHSWIQVYTPMSQIYRVDERYYAILCSSPFFQGLDSIVSIFLVQQKYQRMEVCECVWRPSAHRENMNNHAAGLGFNSEFLQVSQALVVLGIWLSDFFSGFLQLKKLWTNRNLSPPILRLFDLRKHFWTAPNP